MGLQTGFEDCDEDPAGDQGHSSRHKGLAGRANVMSRNIVENKNQETRKDDAMKTLKVRMQSLCWI